LLCGQRFSFWVSILKTLSFSVDSCYTCILSSTAQEIKKRAETGEKSLAFWAAP